MRFSFLMKLKKIFWNLSFGMNRNSLDLVMNFYPKSYRIRYRQKVRAFVVDRFPFLILYLIKEKRWMLFQFFTPAEILKLGKSGFNFFQAKKSRSISATGSSFMNVKALPTPSVC